MNAKEEMCIELIEKGAFAHAHEEMQKLTEEERANVENNMPWDVFDGYEMWLKEQNPDPADSYADETKTI